jgi:hypothetical protein
MSGIDKYMIPLDSIRSTGVGGIMAMILLALPMGMSAALIVVGIVSSLLEPIRSRERRLRGSQRGRERLRTSLDAIDLDSDATLTPAPA